MAVSMLDVSLHIPRNVASLAIKTGSALVSGYWQDHACSIACMQLGHISSYVI